jgi:hypothetical protein
MARTALIVKASRKPKFSTRKINRCWRCGRIPWLYRDFKLLPAFASGNSLIMATFQELPSLAGNRLFGK